jgi:hypothetical protein
MNIQNVDTRFSLKVLYLSWREPKNPIKHYQLSGSDSPSKSYTWLKQETNNHGNFVLLESRFSLKVLYSISYHTLNITTISLIIRLRFSLKVLYFVTKILYNRISWSLILSTDSPQSPILSLKSNLTKKSTQSYLELWFSLKVLYFVLTRTKETHQNQHTINLRFYLKVLYSVQDTNTPSRV